MDVRPIVPSPAVAKLDPLAQIGLGTPRPAVGIPAAIAAILDSSALSLFSASDMAKLMGLLEPRTLLPQLTQSQDLLASAVRAVQRGDVERALEPLAELVRTDPGRALMLGSDPGLAPIQTRVNQLLNHLETVASLEAQGRIAHATEALASLGGIHKLPGWDTPPEVLLAVANHLFEAGGYVNYVHAASLGQVLFEAATRVRTETAGAVRKTPVTPPSRRATPGVSLGALWRRLPLLVLLAGWFAGGLAAAGFLWLLHGLWPAQFPASMLDFVFQLWGIGFLALICFGFYIRVRKVRFR